MNLPSLISEGPDWILLTVAVLTHADVLDGSEVSPVDTIVTGTSIKLIKHSISIAVISAGITNTISIGVKLVRVVYYGTVIILVQDSIIVSIIITYITLTIII